jgi:hypothetical protein
MNRKPELAPEHSAEILRLAARTLKNAKASDEAKALAASILGGPAHAENPGPGKRAD